jgi:hypothetical protein
MNGSQRSSAMPQSSATGEPSPSEQRAGAATPVARAAIESLRLLFRVSSHRFRPKGGCHRHCDCDDDGCRPHCGCDDESAVDCASPRALAGPLSTPKANWGRSLAKRSPRAYRPRKRRSRQERNASGHPFRAERTLAPSSGRMLSTVCPSLGGRTQVLALCERLGDPAREVCYWPKCEVPECPQLRRHWGKSGLVSDVAKPPKMTQTGLQPGRNLAARRARDFVRQSVML